MRFSCRVLAQLFVCLLLINTAMGQVTGTGIDSITKHLNLYAKTSKPKLFTHLDKTVYVNNETGWFTAYLLNAAENLSKHQVLAVSLVNNNDQTIAAESKFPMAEGIAYGTLTVPDTIPPGNYSFIAQTNIMDGNGKPNALFIQPVTIKSALQTSFNADMILDTLYKDPTNARVMINVRGQAGPLNGATINYLLGKDKKTRFEGAGKTNVLGSYILMIPKDRINAVQHKLEVQIKLGKEVKNLRLEMPVKQSNPDVKFYPEGGHLIAGLTNRVGWEVKTPGGAAVKTQGILFANNKPIDTLETDSYGMGQFAVIPQLGVNYTVKLMQDKPVDLTYNLPAALPNGLIIKVSDALAEDTLKARMATVQSGKFTLVVHNYKQIFLTTVFDANHVGRNFKLDLTDVPRGINAITILDSLDRPVTERIFFAHYNQKPAIEIGVDDNQPQPRQKVTVKLRLNGSDKKDALGLVSIACAQDSRFEVKKSNNIESFVYLQSELDNLPIKDNLMGNAEPDHQYLNELLLIRGWSKYNWPDMMKTSVADTIKTHSELNYSGTVTYVGKPIKKGVAVIMVKDTANVSVLNTDAKGHFVMTSEDVMKQTEKNIGLIVNGTSDLYAIALTDPYLAVQKEIGKTIEPFMFDQPIANDTREFALSGSNKVTNLREVKVKGSTEDELFGVNHLRGANACGDYVCPYHILNCPNHVNDLGNRAPKKGELVMSVEVGHAITYNGCVVPEKKIGMTLFSGISFAKEYYGSDYSTVSGTAPDYISTIYWKHSVKLKAGEEVNLSFYTSDITGKFRIVVQGITNEDVIYGETFFNVNKPSAK